jgi:myotubularin-related protein 1/2
MKQAEDQMDLNKSNNSGNFLSVASSLNRGTSIISTDESSAYPLDNMDADPPLLPGERIVKNLKGREVALVDPFAGPIRGYLSVTNYKLYFKSCSTSSLHLREETNIPIILTLPLCTVSRVEKIGGSTSKGEHSYCLDIHCKDIRYLRFALKPSNHSRREVYDAIMLHAFPHMHRIKVFAFEYKEKFSSNGWNVYDPVFELKRQGLPNESWRISKINQNYKISDTYPSIFAVPTTATDDDLKAVASFRSRGRIPILSWLHPITHAAIVRCSQPLVGVSGRKNQMDEKYFEMIMEANADRVTLIESNPRKIHVMDARPLVNAIANKARGGGYESEETYSNAEITFLDIPSIHVVRESFRKLSDLCLSGPDDVHWYWNLENTHWLENVRTILAGALKIVDKIENSEETCIVHCSDGWDRTAQLTSLSMLMLDPYYRTLTGFQVLIEKEWTSVGHKFEQRIGHGDDHFQDQERSPIFVQFIDCVYQLTKQFPRSFEFNENYLITILQHVYSCRFGTFLLNCESQRIKEKIMTKTISLWSFINEDPSDFRNAFYSDEGDSVLYPVASLRRICLWSNYYCRWNMSLRVESTRERSREFKQIKQQLPQKVNELRRQLEERLSRMRSTSDNNSTSSGETVSPSPPISIVLEDSL